MLFLSAVHRLSTRKIDFWTGTIVDEICQSGPDHFRHSHTGSSSFQASTGDLLQRQQTFDCHSPKGGKSEIYCLANLILDQPVIRELIQEDLSVEALHHELEGLLFDGSKRKKLFADYQQLAQVMGGPGASEKAARIIIHATHPKK